jgi:hypothetical protein
MVAELASWLQIAKGMRLNAAKQTIGQYMAAYRNYNSGKGGDCTRKEASKMGCTATVTLAYATGLHLVFTREQRPGSSKLIPGQRGVEEEQQSKLPLPITAAWADGTDCRSMFYKGNLGVLVNPCNAWQKGNLPNFHEISPSYSEGFFAAAVQHSTEMPLTGPPKG